MKGLNIEVAKPDDCTHKTALHIQVGTWKLEILKQERRSD